MPRKKRTPAKDDVEQDSTNLPLVKKKKTTKRKSKKSSNKSSKSPSDNLTNEAIEKILQRYRGYDRYASERPVDFSEVLQQMDEDGIQNRLAGLWASWNFIFKDSDVCSYAFPLGHKNRTLIIGCLDSISMQEIRMSRDFILETANIFLCLNFFKDVKFQLIFGETILSDVDAIDPSIRKNLYLNWKKKTEEENKDKSDSADNYENNLEGNYEGNANRVYDESPLDYRPKLTGSALKDMEDKDKETGYRISYVTRAYKKFLAASKDDGD